MGKKASKQTRRLDKIHITVPIFSGVVPVPAVALGALLGGYLVKKLNLNAEGAMKLALMCSVIALVGQMALLGIGCDSAGIAGIDTTYHDSRLVKIRRGTV